MQLKDTKTGILNIHHGKSLIISITLAFRLFPKYIEINLPLVHPWKYELITEIDQ